MKYKSITTKKFWQLVNDGHLPARHTFLIMSDGSQNWGYPMSGNFFDHHRQGLCHNQSDIQFVLVPEKFGKSYKSEKI